MAVDEAGPLGAAAAAACRGLGARVVSLQAGSGGCQTLVFDAAGRFAAEPGAGLAALRAGADAAWEAIREVATGAMIEAPEGGKVVLLAPPPGAGAHAQAAREALENMSRTLSIEWARYDIRLTTISPGPGTEPAEVGDLVAYLASPAGDYFSGCAFSLGEATV